MIELWLISKIRRWYRNYKIRKAMCDPNWSTKVSEILMAEVRNNLYKNNSYWLSVPKFVGKFPIRKDLPCKHNYNIGIK